MLGSTTLQPTAPSSYSAPPILGYQWQPPMPDQHSDPLQGMYEQQPVQGPSPHNLTIVALPSLCRRPPPQNAPPQVKDMGIDATLTLLFHHADQLVNATLCRRLRKFGISSVMTSQANPSIEVPFPKAHRLGCSLSARLVCDRSRIVQSLPLAGSTPHVMGEHITLEKGLHRKSTFKLKQYPSATVGDIL